MTSWRSHDYHPPSCPTKHPLISLFRTVIPAPIVHSHIACIVFSSCHHAVFVHYPNIASLCLAENCILIVWSCRHCTEILRISSFFLFMFGPYELRVYHLGHTLHFHLRHYAQEYFLLSQNSCSQNCLNQLLVWQWLCRLISMWISFLWRQFHMWTQLW